MTPKKLVTDIGTPPNEHAESAVEALDHVATSFAKFADVFGQSLELEKTRMQIEREKLDKLYEIVIEGNGKESIRAQVNRHELFFTEFNKLKWLIIAQFVSIMFVIGYAVFDHFVNQPLIP